MQNHIQKLNISNPHRYFSNTRVHLIRGSFIQQTQCYRDLKKPTLSETLTSLSNFYGNKNLSRWAFASFYKQAITISSTSYQSVTHSGQSFHCNRISFLALIPLGGDSTIQQFYFFHFTLSQYSLPFNSHNPFKSYVVCA